MNHEPNEPKMNQYIDDGKREAFAELDKTIPLYTASDLKAAKLETVERCITICNQQLQNGWIVCLGAMKKLKEEIENEL